MNMHIAISNTASCIDQKTDIHVYRQIQTETKTTKTDIQTKRQVGKTLDKGYKKRQMDRKCKQTDKKTDIQKRIRDKNNTKTCKQIDRQKRQKDSQKGQT